MDIKTKVGQAVDLINKATGHGEVTIKVEDRKVVQMNTTIKEKVIDD